MAATAPVGETRAPSTKQAGHDKGTAVRAVAQCATTATTPVVASTSHVASSTIEATLARTSRYEIVSAS